MRWVGRPDCDGRVQNFACRPVPATSPRGGWLTRDLLLPGAGTMTAELPDIEQLRLRLATLERRTARLRWTAGVTGAALVLTLGVAGTGAVRRGALSRDGSLEGQQVVLHDATGAVRAVLGVRSDGSVGLMLADGEARPRAMLGVARDGGPALGLSDRQGRLRAAFAVAADGSANVGFLDRDQTVRTTLGTSENGAPALSLVDDDHRVRAALQADTDGTSLLRLFDGAGKPRVALGLNHDAPSLVMLDEDGGLLGEVPGR